MKKFLLGLTAMFALTTAVPVFAGEDKAADEKPAKKDKKDEKDKKDKKDKKGGKKAPKKGEDKKAE